MQVHRELFITGHADRLRAAVEDMLGSLTDRWSRDEGAEGYMNQTGDRRAYCFVSPKWPRQPKASIFLLEKGPTTLYVANIVPSDIHQLSRDEYNAILMDFYHRYAKPAATRNGVAVEITEPAASIEAWLPGNIAEKLRRFSHGANKSTGSSHPADRERWYEFLVAAQESDFSPSMLERWLIEEEGWGAEVANGLAIEYEFARGLLDFSSRVRA